MTMPVLVAQSVVPCRHELLAHRAQPTLASIMLSTVTALGSPAAFAIRASRTTGCAVGLTGDAPVVAPPPACSCVCLGVCVQAARAITTAHVAALRTATRERIPPLPAPSVSVEYRAVAAVVVDVQGDPVPGLVVPASVLFVSLTVSPML
jgi:hypothetical protein